MVQYVLAVIYGTHTHTSPRPKSQAFKEPVPARWIYTHGFFQKEAQSCELERESVLSLSTRFCMQKVMNQKVDHLSSAKDKKSVVP